MRLGVDFTLGGTPERSAEVYSVLLSAATARCGSGWFAGNPCAYGQAILLGRPFEDSDLYLAIRVVPDPGRSLLLVAGLLLFQAPSVRVRLVPATDARRPQHGTP